MSWMPLEPIGEGLGGLLETLPRGPSRVAPPRVEKREGTRKREEETRDKREEQREETRGKREETHRTGCAAHSVGRARRVSIGPRV
mgnify:CR=1 FL=1